MTIGPDFTFEIECAAAAERAASPTLALSMRIDAIGAERQIHAILLRCQIHIEAMRRAYSEEEQARLFELFGPPGEWGRTLHSLLWTEAAVNVPGFTGSTRVDLPIPCTYDFNLATTKYFDALSGGEVPLSLLLSGTVFYASGQGSLQVAPLSWERQAGFCLPVRLWRELIDRHYDGGIWVRLPRDLLEGLNEYKRRTASPTLERALQQLLPKPALTQGENA